MLREDHNQVCRPARASNACAPPCGDVCVTPVTQSEVELRYPVEGLGTSKYLTPVFDEDKGVSCSPCHVIRCSRYPQ